MDKRTWSFGARGFILVAGAAAACVLTYRHSGAAPKGAVAAAPVSAAPWTDAPAKALAPAPALSKKTAPTSQPAVKAKAKAEATVQAVAPAKKPVVAASQPAKAPAASRPQAPRPAPAEPQAPPPTPERRVLIALDALRAQTVLYALQHEDRLPDFARYPSFEQLRKPTNVDGSIVRAAGDMLSPTGPQVYGPYMKSVPVNPLNGRSRVAVVEGELKPGQKVESADAGWVLSTAARKLYATDAAGCVFDDAKARPAHPPPEAARPGKAPVSPVQVLRNKVALYMLQHKDQVPDLKRYPKWEQLTSRTREDGTPDPAGKFGPYVKSVPLNPRNGSTEVDVVERTARGYVPARKVGYVFESSTGRIWMTDEQNKPLADD